VDDNGSEEGRGVVLARESPEIAGLQFRNERK